MGGRPGASRKGLMMVETEPAERGRPVLVVTDHAPSLAPVRLEEGDRVVAGRWDLDDWPAFRQCHTADGAEAWVPDRFVGAERWRTADPEPVEAAMLAGYDTTELVASAGDVVRALDEDGLWLWCETDDGRAGWLPLARVSLDLDRPDPAVPTGPLPHESVPPDVFATEWVEGAPWTGRPEPDGTGVRGFPLRGTRGLTSPDYFASPTAKRRHELHRGVFVFPDREPLQRNLLRTSVGLALSQQVGDAGWTALSGPTCRLDAATVVWPWLAVSTQRPGAHGQRGIEGPPDLAVEVADPDGWDPYLSDRLALLAEHGTPEIWLLEPGTGAVEVRDRRGRRRVEPHEPVVSIAVPDLVLIPEARRPPGRS